MCEGVCVCVCVRVSRFKNLVEKMCDDGGGIKVHWVGKSAAVRKGGMFKRETLQI
jgi:hypothetical protein